MRFSEEQTASLFCARCRAAGRATWVVDAGSHYGEITLNELSPGFRFITGKGPILATIECMRCSTQVLVIDQHSVKRAG